MNSLSTMRYFFAIAFGFLIMACNQALQIETFDEQQFYKALKPTAENELSVQYFGIGSTLISYNGKAVFTDPCFSTPSLQEVAFGNISTDTALIKLLNPPLQNVQLTLIGHAHYDHLLDLPFLASKYLPKESTVVGCQSAQHLIASANIQQKFVVANNLKGNYNTPGKWIYSKDSTVRVIVFLGHHPPQIARIIKFGIGQVKAPLNKIPTKASKWKEGETYTFLIDFLDPVNGQIEKRVFTQTSSGKPPRGMVPLEILAERNIDVAIIPADFHRTFKAIDRLKADQYIIVHWENFFRSKLLKAQPFSKRSIHKIKNKIKELGLEKKVVIPVPGEFLVF